MVETLQVIAWVAGSLGALVTGCSAFLAYRSLQRQQISFQADHDRSKRALGVNLILQWNASTLSHRRAIEKTFPGLIDRQDGKIVELTKQQAQEIYTAQPGSDHFELRFHLIELLNFFEAVAVAYQHGVADQVLIDQCFKGTLLNYHGALHNFMKAVEKSRGYNAWAPYENLINNWNANDKTRRPAPDEQQKG